MRNRMKMSAAEEEVRSEERCQGLFQMCDRGGGRRKGLCERVDKELL